MCEKEVGAGGGGLGGGGRGGALIISFHHVLSERCFFFFFFFFISFQGKFVFLFSPSHCDKVVFYFHQIWIGAVVRVSLFSSHLNGKCFYIHYIWTGGVFIFIILGGAGAFSLHLD